MQKDMHFYGVYALARAAGVKDATALTIARASQFVDDATDDDVVTLQNKTTILSTMTSHQALNVVNAIPGDQWRVWVPFHFLPGNEPKDGDFYQRMVCRKNSDPAKRMKAFALDQDNKKHWPHLIGIAAHVYADTFSHFGFTGYSCDGNKVKEYTVRVTGEGAKNIVRLVGKLVKQVGTTVIGWVAERIPVGHGAVSTFPDHPCISWTFEYENGNGHGKEDTDRDNRANYIEGCRCLHEFFQQYLQASPQDKDGNGKAWDALAPIVKDMLQGKSGASLDERITRWKNAIRAGVFCTATDTDRTVDYAEDCWDLEACAKRSDQNALEDARGFIRAAFLHRDFVLHTLLPSLNLVTY